MEDKKINDEKLRKFEELVVRLEKISEEKTHQHPHHPEGPHPKHPHPPIPPHERKDFKIDFSNDKELLENIFGDEDTTKAVIDVITISPTEIQIVLKVVIDLYNKVNDSKGE